MFNLNKIILVVKTYSRACYQVVIREGPSDLVKALTKYRFNTQIRQI